MATLALTAPEDGVYLTAEEYFRLPPGPPFYQLVDGQLYMSPAPHLWNHQRILENIHVELAIYLRANAIGRAFQGPVDVKLGDQNVFQPDLIYLENARLRGGEAYLDGPPDLSVEILSPSTAKLDLTRKRAVLQAHGAPEIWFVDRKKRKVEVVRRNAEGYSTILLGEGDVLETPLLPGLRLNVTEIFHDPTR
jgi:Uma2 family endonuclease